MSINNEQHLSLNSLKSRAHASYSGRNECCFIECENLNIYPGVRVESIVYPLTIEAPQCAIGICLSEGQKPTTLYHPYEQFSDLPLSYKVYAEAFNLNLCYLEPAKRMEIATVNLFASKISKLPPAEQLHLQLNSAQSGFGVFAQLKVNGKWLRGHNFEHSSFSLGLCAERVVLAKALSYDLPIGKHLHISTHSGQLATPCGACRQLIHEYMHPASSIEMWAEKAKEIHLKAKELLPFAFKASFEL